MVLSFDFLGDYKKTQKIHGKSSKNMLYCMHINNDQERFVL